MPGLFVTGTGTDVGKTFVTAGLLRACRRAGLAADALKPVLSGYDPREAAESDAGRLLAAMGRPVTPEAVAAKSPWRFAAPLSPNMAAALENRSLTLDEVATFCRTASREGTLTLIEGVGGVMVPLNHRHTVLDLMVRLALPVLLVSATRLGAISHCLTAVCALAARGLAPATIVLSDRGGSDVSVEATAETIRSFCPGIPVALVEDGAAEASFDALLAGLQRRLSIGSSRPGGSAARGEATRV